MKVEIVSYTCANCAHTFDAPALGENVYGEFLLWSKHGRVAYLNALEDKTYKSIDCLLESSQKNYGLPPLDRAKILRRIYGSLVCDPDEDGSSYEIGALPPCPKCGSEKVSSWRFKSPAEIVDLFIPVVTHNRWNLLTEAEKQSQVDAAL